MNYKQQKQHFIKEIIENPEKYRDHPHKDKLIEFLNGDTLRGTYSLTESVGGTYINKLPSNADLIQESLQPVEGQTEVYRILRGVKNRIIEIAGIAKKILRLHVDKDVGEIEIEF